MDGEWDIVVSYLQDIFNRNEEHSFDEIKDLVAGGLHQMSDDQLRATLEKVTNHKQNIEKSRRMLDEMLVNINTLIASEAKRKAQISKQKYGRSFWTSAYNVSDSITLSSEVAFKLRQRGSEDDWIQCEVTKIIGDGTKFEVRDPEPDENNNPGKTFKATWKDIIQIPNGEQVRELIDYPQGTKVLARYPETTTFYTAEVVGTKRDGTCRLMFEGEEEEGKETEVERRLVLPYPSK